MRFSFDRAVNFYDTTRGWPDDAAAQIVQVLYRHLPMISKAKVLEIGVGTGRVAIPMTKVAPAVTGIDISIEMLRTLRAKCDTWLNPAVVLADAQRLPFAAATFDVIVAVSVLHLLENWGAALEEARRTLKPGGFFLYGRTTYAGADSELYERLRFGFVRLHHDPSSVGLAFHTIPVVLNSYFQSVNEFVAATWHTDFTIGAILDQFRNRIWSETWDMTDAGLLHLTDSIEQWAAHEAYALDHVYRRQCHFMITLYAQAVT